MAANEVKVGNETVISLVEDTVTPETLKSGAPAHDASGNLIVGILSDNLNPELDTLHVQGIDYTLTTAEYEELVELCGE